MSRGMGKRAALKLLESSDVTWEQLREHLLSLDMADLGGESRVNPRAPLATAYTTYMAALAGKSGPVLVWVPDVYSKTARMRRHGASLIAQNILRDFGPPRGLRAHGEGRDG